MTQTIKPIQLPISDISEYIENLAKTADQSRLHKNNLRTHGKTSLTVEISDDLTFYERVQEEQRNVPTSHPLLCPKNDMDYAIQQYIIDGAIQQYVQDVMTYTINITRVPNTYLFSVVILEFDGAKFMDCLTTDVDGTLEYVRSNYEPVPHENTFMLLESLTTTAKIK